MNCKYCNKEMARLYSEGIFIDKKRQGKEIGFSCINLKCKNYKKKVDLKGNLK